MKSAAIQLSLILVLSCWSWVYPLAAVQAPAKQNELDVFSDSKPMIKLVRKEKRVAVEFSENWQDFQEITNNVRKKVQNSGSSSSRGGGGWLTKMQGTAGVFAILYGTRSFPDMPLMLETNGGLGVLLQQNNAPHNELRIAAGPEHKTLNLQLVRPADDFLFTFEQKANGTIHCKLLDGTEIVSIGAKDYESLVRENWQVINSSIAPVLRQCGVEPPLNRYTKVVWTQFLAMLRPTDGIVQQEFEAVVEQLDSTRFSDRETASQELKQQYEKWQALIQKAALDPQRSIECRSRLNKILEELSTEEQKQGQQVVSALALEKDVSYLVWLANRLQDEPDWKADQQHLFDQLERVTGQSYGSDVAQWNEYRDPLEPKSTVVNDTSVFTSTIDLASLEGPVDLVRQEINELLPLAVEDGKLQMDRNQWYEFFDQKTPQQVMDELSGALEKYHLPSDWIQPSGIYNRDTVGYPQILFDSLRLKFDEQNEKEAVGPKQYVRISRRSLNRDFNIQVAQAVLRLHKPLPENQRELFVMNGRVVNGIKVNDAKPQKEEFFFLEVQEKTGAKRKVSFKANKQGDLSLTIGFNEAESLVRYIQRVNPDGSFRCVFQDLRGADIFVASAASFEDLISKNRQYYDEQWSVILDSLGIRFPR